MKKNILIYGLSAFLCMSCSNYLDIKPYGKTIPKTAEEFSALLHSHLQNIDTGSDKLLVGNTSQLLVWDAGCGDDFETCLTASGGFTLDTYLGNVAFGTRSRDYYSSLYETIRDCNIVLNELEESGTNEANVILGTAYAMRAVAYYQLMRLFCEVPETGNFSEQLGLPLVMTFDMEEKPVRSTLEETINLIDGDLKKALSYHPSDDIYRFTEDVIKGYQIRLYFWTKQWTKALPLAQELLTKYPLLEGDAYKTMMKTAYDLAGNQLLKSYRSISSTGGSDFSSSNSTLQYRPVSQRFLSLFTDEEKVSDIRYSLWVNKRRQSIKTFFCGMRSAEFKLVEAECYYHLGEADKALKSINELRAHRINDYTDLTKETLPSLSGTELIKKDAEGHELTLLMGLILKERRKELFLEGDRFFELKRNGSPEYWVAFDGLKYMIKKYMYTLPIPAHDILLVDGLIQNEGYTDISN
ncbi:RagB/SusD family nutrient uptake outer membrane protein [Bacteroides bouchesdurhonensis]|uniref:RagB/SusD family nutrient uptake outer membrane protein n=1 Tax=Bacteroides bouchesdurhonensis TaxID=1841855 RepID=UPI0011DD2644|nr:RagB/SusD family nutrient uptake outer membrane protein [Bacteroides bouchesdurhonensis]